MAAAPLWAAPFTITLLNYIGISALVVLGIVLLTGVGGMTSFGQAAFVGIAAYATAWLTTAEGASPWLGLLFALALTGLVAALLGAVTLRLSGHFLPLGTIAWGIAIYYRVRQHGRARPQQRPLRRAADRDRLALARTHRGDLLSDLGPARGGDAGDRQSPRIARGPRHPQPARRHRAGREPRHRCVPRQADHLHHRRVAGGGLPAGSTPT